jgi:hypothetical protein
MAHAREFVPVAGCSVSPSNEVFRVFVVGMSGMVKSVGFHPEIFLWGVDAVVHESSLENKDSDCI